MKYKISEERAIDGGYIYIFKSTRKKINIRWDDNSKNMKLPSEHRTRIAEVTGSNPVEALIGKFTAMIILYFVLPSIVSHVVLVGKANIERGKGGGANWSITKEFDQINLKFFFSEL